MEKRRTIISLVLGCLLGRCTIDSLNAIGIIMAPILRMAFALAVCFAVVDATKSSAEGPTNVLFMLIDDLGYADVGYHGQNVGSTIPTPTIDALSDAGVRLEQYYVAQLCSPTRTSLMSGRYPYNIGMNDEVIVNGHPSCLSVNVSTIADRLHAGLNTCIYIYTYTYDRIESNVIVLVLVGGWATSAYGKWDLGMTSWGCTPTCRGFDHFFGVRYVCQAGVLSVAPQTLINT